MATVITEECINCGACEPECPNTAIYQGGVEYEQGGQKIAAISEEIFYIVPEKCTECVGFFDYEACAAVCPVDCCIPDPDRPESEEALLVRAQELHPDKDFGDEFPSRFREGAGAKPSAAAADGGGGESAVAAAAPVAAAGGAVAAVAGPAMVGRVERATGRPQRMLDAGDPTTDFPGELDIDFDSALAMARRPVATPTSRVVGAGLAVAMPVLGGLDHETKRGIEQAYGDRRFFSSQLSTALNVLHNFIVYPVVFFVIGLFSGLTPFTEGDKSWIFLGVLLASIETMVRLRSGIFGAVPVDKMRYGASLYGAPLGLLLRPVVRRVLGSYRGGWVPVEGFYAREFESKREREKRYGEVYTIEEYDNGYYVRLELPREIPPSAAKEELGLGDEMPDYDLKLGLNNGSVVVRGSIVDAELRAVCGVSPAFPADFETSIPLARGLRGFRHRYAGKLLEIAVLKHGAVTG
jgi:ferredoxin